MSYRLYEVTIKRRVLVAARDEDEAWDIGEAASDAELDANDPLPAEVDRVDDVLAYQVNDNYRRLVPRWNDEDPPRDVLSVGELIEKGLVEKP